MITIIIIIIILLLLSGSSENTLTASAQVVENRSGGSSITETMDFNSSEYNIISNAQEFQAYIKAKGRYQEANEYSWGDACWGFSAAYSDAIYMNNFSIADNVSDNDPEGLTHYGYEGEKTYSSEQEMLQAAYNELNNNRPVILHVNGNVEGTSRHFVVAIGYKNTTNASSVLETDFLILDVWDAEIEAMGGKNSGTRFITSGRDCGWDYDYKLYTYF